MPKLISLSIFISMMGLLFTVSIGLGKVSVNGLNLSPRPPAMIRATVGIIVRIFFRLTICTISLSSLRTGKNQISSFLNLERFSGLISFHLRLLKFAFIYKETLSEISLSFSRPRLISPSVRVPTILFLSNTNSVRISLSGN